MPTLKEIREAKEVRDFDIDVDEPPAPAPPSAPDPEDAPLPSMPRLIIPHTPTTTKVTVPGIPLVEGENVTVMVYGPSGPPCHVSNVPMPKPNAGGIDIKLRIDATKAMEVSKAVVIYRGDALCETEFAGGAVRCLLPGDTLEVALRIEVGH